MGEAAGVGWGGDKPGTVPLPGNRILCIQPDAHFWKVPCLPMSQIPLLVTFTAWDEMSPLQPQACQPGCCVHTPAVFLCM